MLSRCSSLALSDLKKLDGKIRDRLAWSDTELLRSILAFLDTRSWTAPVKTTLATEEEPDEEQIQEEADDKAEIRAAMHYITSVFRKQKEPVCFCWMMSSRMWLTTVGSILTVR